MRRKSSQSPQTSTSVARRLDDPVTAWARAAVAGKIVVGELVRYAAERHLRDLRDGSRRGLYWRPDRAADALDFFPSVLSITDGLKAGEPFHLVPWAMFCVGSLFGWHQADGLRRFRKSWWETGKGQSKTPTMAAVGLYMMGFCGTRRATVYAIAQDRIQANVLFADAVALCRATMPGEDEGVSLESQKIVEIRGNLDNAYKIEHGASQSKFESWATERPISGPRPVLVAADEIHEFRSAKPIEMWNAALVKSAGDSLFMLGTNTPAADQPVCAEYSEMYQAVVKDVAPDDSAFVFIARTDKDDQPFEDEACWVKSLPALGITFPAGNLRKEVAAAKELIGRALSIKRLYFGIPVGSSEYWISEAAWRGVQGPVNPASLKGKQCWLAMDLSKKNDLTALTAVWREDDGHLLAKTWYWAAREGLEDRAIEDHAPYLEYVEQKLLTPVPGPTIKYTFVAAQIAALVAEHDVQALVFDPTFFVDFAQACSDVGLPVWVHRHGEPAGAGLKMIRHAQGTRISLGERQLTEGQLCMPHSVTALEDLILEGGITIDASRLTDLCSMNAAMDEDGLGNRAFDKSRSRGRIDGLVTIAMATGAAMLAEEDAGVYRGLYSQTGGELEPENTDEWSPDVLRDMAHPLFAEHKARFERWQDRQPEDRW